MLFLNSISKCGKFRGTIKRNRKRIMNKMTLVFQNSAKQDIKDIVKWYNSKKQGLGKEFYSEVNPKQNSL